MLTDNNNKKASNSIFSNGRTEFTDRLGLDALLEMFIKDSTKIAQMKQLIAENIGAETVLREYLKRRFAFLFTTFRDIPGLSNLCSFKSPVPTDKQRDSDRPDRDISDLSSFKSSAPRAQWDNNMLTRSAPQPQFNNNMRFRKAEYGSSILPIKLPKIPIDFNRHNLDEFLRREFLDQKMIDDIKEMLEKNSGSEIVLRKFLEYSQFNLAKIFAGIMLLSLQ